MVKAENCVKGGGGEVMVINQAEQEQLFKTLSITVVGKKVLSHGNVS